MNYVSTSDASLALGIDRDTLRRLCMNGKVPGAFRHGKYWKIPTEYVDGLVHRNYEQLYDVMGTPVPDFLSEVFKSKQLVKIVRNLNSAISEFKKIVKWNPFVPSDMIVEVTKLRDMVSGCQVARICNCGSVGCPLCRGHGWLPKSKSYKRDSS